MIIAGWLIPLYISCKADCEPGAALLSVSPGCIILLIPHRCKHSSARLRLVCCTREAGMWHGASKGTLGPSEGLFKILESHPKSIWFTDLINISWKPTISYTGSIRWGMHCEENRQRPTFVELEFQWWETDPVIHKNAVYSEKCYPRSQVGEGADVGWVVVLAWHSIEVRQVGVWRVREDLRKPIVFLKQLKDMGIKGIRNWLDLRQKVNEAAGPNWERKARDLARILQSLGFFPPWGGRSEIALESPTLPVLPITEEWKSRNRVALPGTASR